MNKFRVDSILPEGSLIFEKVSIAEIIQFKVLSIIHWLYPGLFKRKYRLVNPGLHEYRRRPNP